MEEIFKDIPGYKGLYQISNLGRVKSLKRKGRLKDIIIRNSLNTKGYPQVGISKNCRAKNFTVHKLMAITFLNHEYVNRTIVVDHINGIRTDNRLENLQIISQRDNVLKGRLCTNYSGIKQVGKKEKYKLTISYKNKGHYIGVFDDRDFALKIKNSILRLIDEVIEVSTPPPIKIKE